MSKTATKAATPADVWRQTRDGGCPTITDLATLASRLLPPPPSGALARLRTYRVNGEVLDDELDVRDEERHERRTLHEARRAQAVLIRWGILEAVAHEPSVAVEAFRYRLRSRLQGDSDERIWKWLVRTTPAGVAVPEPHPLLSRVRSPLRDRAVIGYNLNSRELVRLWCVLYARLRERVDVAPGHVLDELVVEAGQERPRADRMAELAEKAGLDISTVNAARAQAYPDGHTWTALPARNAP